MAVDVEAWPGFHTTFPRIHMHRGPVCQTERLPIQADRGALGFRTVCPSCGFEGRFPPNTRAASTVRRWLSNESRRQFSDPRTDDPHPRVTSGEEMAEGGR